MKLTTNGIFELKTNRSVNASCFLVSGSFGAGTLDIGYKDGDGVFIALDSASSEGNSQHIITHGTPIKMFAKVAGSTDANIEIIITSLA